jgi:hypothetical protein
LEMIELRRRQTPSTSPNRQVPDRRAARGVEAGNQFHFPRWWIATLLVAFLVALIQKGLNR